MINNLFASLKKFRNSNLGRCLEDKNSDYTFIDYFIKILGATSDDNENYYMQNITVYILWMFRINKT